ncbi:hypothetical protein HaLaN_01066 [Haematococcus lacustris]|uniref:Uncharacterized protein n=1 Tax=Haematococcus lacustris TaxID=44745 RepID=A0A699YAP8_HAELA|nr:hypothetical protein HaLaN_01066 [Haematococcus lacustris]
MPNPPPFSPLPSLPPTRPHLLEELLQRPVLGSVQPQPLPCPLGVQVHLPHRVPGGQGDGDVLQVLEVGLDRSQPPLGGAASIVQATALLQLALGQLQTAELVSYRLA